MKDNLKPKSLQLTPEGVVLAKQLLARRKAIQADLDAFAKKRDEEGEMIRKAGETELDTIFTQLLAASGISPLEAKKWELHGDFLEDHGLGFMVPLEGRPCRSCGQVHDEEDGEHPLAAFLKGLGAKTPETPLQ